MTATSQVIHKLLLCVAGAGAVVALGCRAATSTAPQQRPPQVSVLALAPQPVTLTTDLPGRTAPYLVAEIRPRVSGLVQDRKFTEGSDVTAGSVLFQIDPAPYQAAFDRAQAALAVARAQLPALRSRSERLASLAEAHAVGQQDADDAAAALAQAEANAQAAEAALESARLDLAYTPVTAPISGRIGRSEFTIGALVSAYQPAPLAVVQQLDPIYVDVTQSSAQLLRLRRKLAEGRLRDGSGRTSVQLLLEDGTPYPERGRLEFRDVTVDPATGSVMVRLVFPNPDHVLLPGMFVRAVIEEGVAEQALLAPQQAVTRDPKGNPIAFVVTPDSTVEQRTLTVERAIGDSWLVSDGLAPGDRLVVEGRDRVRAGTAVETTPFAPAAGGDAGPARPGSGA